MIHCTMTQSTWLCVVRDACHIWSMTCSAAVCLIVDKGQVRVMGGAHTRASLNPMRKVRGTLDLLELCFKTFQAASGCLLGLA